VAVIVKLCNIWLQRSGEMSSLDDLDDDDDDVDDLHLMDSDADDEFECDCPVCLMHQQHISGITAMCWCCSQRSKTKKIVVLLL